MHVLSTGMTSSSPAAPRWDARLWGALILLCGVVFLDGLDVSMVGVALPSIQADLGLTTSQLQWVVSAYVLGLGGLLLLGGRAADLLGRRRVLIAGLAVFTLASLFGGLVDDGALLIASRFLKGARGRVHRARRRSRSITTTFTEGPSRTKALSVFSACGASGFSFGLVFGGLLTTRRLALDVPAAGAGGRARCCSRSRATSPATGRTSAPSAATTSPARCLLTAGMLLLVRTIVEAPDEGWARRRRSPPSPCRSLCWPRSSRSSGSASQPLVRLGIFRSAPLVRANLGAMCLFGAYVGFQFVGDAVPADARSAGARSRPRSSFLPGRPVGRVRRPARRCADRPLRHGAAWWPRAPWRSRSATRSSCASTRRRTC